MDFAEIIGFVLALVFVGVFFVWLPIKLRITFQRAIHPELRPPKGGKKNHDNYNLDLRRFTFEKLKRPIWLKWLFGGLVASFIPLLFLLDTPREQQIGTVLGFMISWVLILLAVSGVIMTGSNGPSDAFLKKFRLERLPNGPIPQNMALAFRWSRLIQDAIIPKAIFPVYGQRNSNYETRTPNAEWWVMRYSFEFKAHTAATQELYEYSLFAFHVDQMLPELVVDGGDVYDFSYFVPKAERETISLEGSFGKKYRLFVPKSNDSKNRLLALSMMTPDVMEIYEQHFANSCMIIEGNTVLLLTRQDIFEDKNYLRFYEGIDALIDKMLREANVRANVGKL